MIKKRIKNDRRLFDGIFRIGIYLSIAFPWESLARSRVRKKKKKKKKKKSIVANLITSLTIERKIIVRAYITLDTKVRIIRR